LLFQTHVTADRKGCDTLVYRSGRFTIGRKTLLRRFAAAVLCSSLLALSACSDTVSTGSTQGINTGFSRVAGFGCTEFIASRTPFWQGFWRGRETDPLIINDDSVREITEYRCFATESACRDWLYFIQSDHPDGTSRTWCRPYDSNGQRIAQAR